MFAEEFIKYSYSIASTTVFWPEKKIDLFLSKIQVQSTWENTVTLQIYLKVWLFSTVLAPLN